VEILASHLIFVQDLLPERVHELASEVGLDLSSTRDDQILCLLGKLKEAKLRATRHGPRVFELAGSLWKDVADAIPLRTRHILDTQIPEPDLFRHMQQILELLDGQDEHSLNTLLTVLVETENERALRRRNVEPMLMTVFVPRVKPGSDVEMHVGFIMYLLAIQDPEFLPSLHQGISRTLPLRERYAGFDDESGDDFDDESGDDEVSS
jgi:hypothetical protein